MSILVIISILIISYPLFGFVVLTHPSSTSELTEPHLSLKIIISSSSPFSFKDKKYVLGASKHSELDFNSAFNQTHQLHILSSFLYTG